jgi:iron complex outermembrane receptor protein
MKNLFLFVLPSIVLLNSVHAQDSLKTKQLDEVIVKGLAHRYKADSTSMVTRMPMSILETPNQIQVITRRLMNDQQAQQLSDVYKNASGVIAANGNAWNGTMMRGFTIGSENYLYNGQRGDAIGQDIVPFLPHIEEVQILKGASGVLFGEGGLGGTINLVTKKPTFGKKYEVGVAGGSFGTYRTTFDATNTLTKSKTFAFRLSGGYEDAGSFMTNFYNKTLIIAPALSYKNRGTLIEWNGSYIYDKRNVSWQNGVPPIGKNIFALDRGWSSNDPGDYAKHNSFLSQLQVKQNLTKGLTFNAQYLYSQSNWVGSYWIHNTQQAVDNAGNIDRYRESNIGNVTYKFNSINAFLNYTLETGKIKHTFIGGFDYNQRNDKYPESQDVLFAGYNVYQNTYNAYKVDTLTTDKYLYAVNTESQAGYVQYLFQWNKKLNVLLGGRYQNYHYDFEFTSFGSEPFTDTSDTKQFLPRVGISYVFNGRYSVFAGYNQGFQPQASNNPRAGGPFPAELGNQFELGVKGDVIKDKLNITLSAYQITKTNVLTPDLNDPAGLKLTTTGEVQSKGLELDVMGNITNNWRVITNFAYNDTKITKSNVAEEVGQNFRNNIPVVANLWTVYQFDKGLLNGFKIGGGVNYSDQRTIIVGNNGLKAPSYALINALVGYEKNNVDLSLNVNNITNADYVSGTSAPNYIFRGAPTNFLLSLRYRFQ